MNENWESPQQFAFSLNSTQQEPRFQSHVNKLPAARKTEFASFSSVKIIALTHTLAVFQSGVKRRQTRASAY